MTAAWSGPNGAEMRAVRWAPSAPAGRVPAGMGPDAVEAPVRHGCIPFVKRE
ncbi:hypothetical protein DM81_1945 [Burkholderia multivorans]|nr:hypothetical protein DM81_1945 [Burkholderia multivorans]